MFQFSSPRSFVYASVTLPLYSTYALIFIFIRGVAGTCANCMFSNTSIYRYASLHSNFLLKTIIKKMDPLFYTKNCVDEIVLRDEFSNFAKGSTLSICDFYNV